MLGALLLLLTGVAPPDLAAVGVVVAEPPGRSVAILLSGGRTRVVAEGDEAFGGQVMKVASDRVLLVFGGERLDLRVTASGPRDDLPPPPAAAPAVAQTASEERAPRVMNREDVQQRLAGEMNRILAETALRPVTEDGRVVGVKLTRIAHDSLLTEAGLRAGDVLTSINGTEIDGMATLISLWPQLQGASELNARGLRDGRPFSISLSLE